MTAIRRDVYVDALLAAHLFADTTYQRDLDHARVKAMTGDFDRTLLGVLEVSARTDGRYAIIDGQHRWAAAFSTGGKDALLVCQIHTGLSIEDEARLFYEIDARRRSLSWWDRWRARRGGGDRKVLDIDDVLARHQLQVEPTARDGNVRATRALETIVDDLGGLEVLDQVLIVVAAAFGRSPDALDGSLLQAVALVLNHYDADELDTDRLVTQLRDLSPRQLRARALALREARRGTIPRLCAAVVIERYNAGRGRKVDEFLIRVPSTSKAGSTYNRDRRQRAAIRRWATAHGYDLSGSRNIPAAVRRAYTQAQTNAKDGTDGTEPTSDGDKAHAAVTVSSATTAAVDVEDDVEADAEDDSEPIQTGDPAGVIRAFRNGRGLKWVMDAYALDYETARDLRQQALSATHAAA